MRAVRKRNAWELAGLVVGAAGGVITMVASFFLASEDHYPGLFYIQREALWDNGQYGVKLTFLLTWFTLLDAVVIPMVLVAGVVSLIQRINAVLPAPPPGWDVQLARHRVKMGLAGLVLLPIWVMLTGFIVFSPESFLPLGGFASILLLSVPTLPMVGPALLFEAVIPPSYVEGAVENIHYTRQNNRVTVHLYVAGRSYATHPGVGQALSEGTRVGLVAGGFFKHVKRIAKL